MPTYYYLAVSGDHRRLTGEIESMTDAAARAELNRMGLSVLSISDKPLADTAGVMKKTFEFEATDRFKKLMNGTIDARDALSAYERLTSEFKFEVHYLCAALATPAEKQIARESGIKRLQAAENAKKALEAERSKPLMQMSLGQIVERAEEKLKTKSTAVHAVVDEAASQHEVGYATLDQVDAALTDERMIEDAEHTRLAAEAAEQVRQAQHLKPVFALEAGETALRHVTPTTAQTPEFTAHDFDFNQQSETPARLTTAPETQKLILNDRPLELREIPHEMLVADGEPKDADSALQALTTQTAVGEETVLASPLVWKGDEDGRASKKITKITPETTHPDPVTTPQLIDSRPVAPSSVSQPSLIEHLNFSFDPDSIAQGVRSLSSVFVAGSVLPVRAAVGEVLTGVLVSFLLAFVLLTLLARYHLTGVSEFALAAAGQGTILAFFVFAALVCRLLVAAHGRMTHAVPLRASVLYGLGSIAIVILGINLAY